MSKNRPSNDELRRRLLAKIVVAENGCFIFVGSLNADGYGKMDIWEDHSVTTHRLAWELEFGEIPDGLCVLHNCPGGDNPACVNPAHLFLGTSIDNRADCVSKNRHAKGERQGHAKLTVDQVREIRRLQNDYSRSVLAGKFGVSKRTVQFIIQGKTWKSV